MYANGDMGGINTRGLALSGEGMEPGSDTDNVELVPRIRPTKQWLQAVEGLWEWEGEHYWLGPDAQTGIIRAVGERGNSVNPIHVISRGRRLSEY